MNVATVHDQPTCKSVYGSAADAAKNDVSKDCAVCLHLRIDDHHAAIKPRKFKRLSIPQLTLPGFARSSANTTILLSDRCA